MQPELITFDCAETLLKCKWEIGKFAVECAREVGLEVPDDAAELYEHFYRANIREFLEINLRKDEVAGQEWYRSIGVKWLDALALPTSKISDIQSVSETRIFGPKSAVFSVFSDVFETLNFLKEVGIRMAVISNWDYSLHRTLKMFDLYDRFELVLASLEEGVEKPDPRLFQICLDKLGVAPEKCIHVGDNEIDDVQGARGVGMHPVLINRETETAMPHQISDLRHLKQVIQWIS